MLANPMEDFSAVYYNCTILILTAMGIVWHRVSVSPFDKSTVVTSHPKSGGDILTQCYNASQTEG